MKKLDRRRESNPGPLASATSALKENVKVLEVEGCRSSVVIAQVAEASCPGFGSRRRSSFFIFFRRPRFFFFLFLLFSRPI